MKRDVSIFEMTQPELKAKLSTLTDNWNRTSMYGSPFGETSTKAELYDLEQEMAQVSRLIKPVKVKPKKSNKKIDEIYDAIDALMTCQAWGFLDELFVYWNLRVWRTNKDALIAYATASLPGKSKLPSRERFMESCLRIHPDPKLWEGLI